MPRPRLFHQRGGTLFVDWAATVALPPSKSSRLFRDVASGNPDLLEEEGCFLACGAKSSAASTGTMITPLGAERW